MAGAAAAVKRGVAGLRIGLGSHTLMRWRSHSGSSEECLFPQLDRTARITVFLRVVHSLIHNRLHRAFEMLEEQPMPRVSKAQLRADRFRSRAVEVLTDPDWLDEGVRYWLEKQLRRERDYIYTENEHAALERIVAAGTLFDGWDDYSVPELLTAACRYKKDGDYEDELVFDKLQARNTARLRLGEMGHLVEFCRDVAGLPLAPFKPDIARYDDVA
jgi:hypothetical protein